MRKKPLHPRIVGLRRELASELARAFGPGGQFVIAPSCGIPQARMSELARGEVDRCSMEWLIRHILRCGGSVTLTVKLGDVASEWMRQRFQARRQALGLPLTGRFAPGPREPWVKVPEPPASRRRRHVVGDNASGG